jgi:hypothetical protein
VKTLNSVLLALLGFGLSFFGCAHPRPQPASAGIPAPPAQSSSTVRTASSLPANSIPGIAQREVIRRQERLRQVDDAALRAHQAIAEGDLESAVSGYQKALDGLPAGQ